jgi:hypothetical protein
MTEKLSAPIVVDTPGGYTFSIVKICRNCELVIEEHSFVHDFLVFEMLSFDVIIGMDWMTRFRATIDCEKRRVELRTSSGIEVSFRGDSGRVPPYPRHPETSLAIMLASLSISDEAVIEREFPPVVCDFVDVFPEDLSGLLPIREVEFRVELMPGTKPISIAPYRLAPIELEELRAQLDELREKWVHSPEYFSLGRSCFVRS